MIRRILSDLDAPPPSLREVVTFVIGVLAFVAVFLAMTVVDVT